MATVAVFLALGGGAYAAFKLPKNSVGSKQIKSNAVGSSKVKNGSLLAGDFKPGQLPAGAQGPKGDSGRDGANGAPGTARAYGFVSSTGVLSRSSDLTASRLGMGSYCVVPAAGSGISVSDEFPVVSADYADGPGPFHIAQLDTVGLGTCAGGWVIYTYTFISGAWNGADVAFSIVAP